MRQHNPSAWRSIQAGINCVCSTGSLWCLARYILGKRRKNGRLPPDKHCCCALIFTTIPPSHARKQQNFIGFIYSRRRLGGACGRRAADRGERHGGFRNSFLYNTYSQVWSASFTSRNLRTAQPVSSIEHREAVRRILGAAKAV